jgi:hypothetical protein
VDSRLIALALGCFLQLTWAARLRGESLHTRYPVLFWYLLLITAHSAGGMLIFTVWGGGIVYGWFWVLSQPLIWAAHLAVALEAFQRMLSEYEGLKRLSQWFIQGALGVAFLVIALVIISPDSLRSWQHFWEVQERQMYSGLTLLIVLFALFPVAFRLAVPANPRIVLVVFGLGFLTQTLLGWSVGLLGPAYAMQAAQIACYFAVGSLMAGVTLFRSAGEEVAHQPRLETAAAAQTSRALTSINESLVSLLRT